MVRYGISITAVLLGPYLLFSWNMSLLTIPHQEPVVAARPVAEILIGLVVLAGGLAVAPTSVGRAVAAAGVALVVLVVGTIMAYLRVSGAVPGAGPLMFILLRPANLALFAALFGWLLVRQRPLVAFILLIFTPLPGVAAYVLTMSGVSAGVSWFTDLLTLSVVGAGGAWLARGLAALLDRRSPDATGYAPGPGFHAPAPHHGGHGRGSHEASPPRLGPGSGG